MHGAIGRFTAKTNKTGLALFPERQISTKLSRHKEILYWVPWVGTDQVVHLYNPAYEFFVFPLLIFSPKPQLKKYFQFWQTTFFVTCSVYFQICWPGCIEVTVESMDGVILNPTTKAFKFTLGEGRSWLWWKKLPDILNKQVLVTNTMVMIQNDFGKLTISPFL